MVGVMAVERAGGRTGWWGNGGLILIGRSRHPRLVKTKSEEKLDEALEMLRTNEIIENSTG